MYIHQLVSIHDSIGNVGLSAPGELSASFTIDYQLEAKVMCMSIILLFAFN